MPQHRIDQMNNISRFFTARITGQLFGALFVAFMIAGCNAIAQTPEKSPKAILIIVDGVPADVLERADTPYMDEIAGANGYTRSYMGGEIGGPSETPTVSAPGYNNVITGTWANKHNVYDNDVEDPNYQYWDMFRIAKTHDPSLHTALFSTWLENRTRLVGDGLPEAGGNKLDYHFDGFEHDTERFPHDMLRTYIRNIDELVTDETARYVVEHGPDLSWVYLEFTDDIGHAFGDSPQQVHAVGIMDGNVGKIWNAVKKRQEEHDEDWLVVITTDHGRDSKTGKDHGGQSERERTTWIVTNSNKLNGRFSEMPAAVDILPSIVKHLGLNMPAAISEQLDGQSFID
jgi:predicted AlkP superfamily pyrophosphatase or phosphodiesterase